MNHKISWGIVGLGNIAGKFALDLALTDGGELAAVASRDIDRARSFAVQHKAGKAYGSYQALFADQQVDAVYIASPHNLHENHTMAALSAGKHVLCEKPLGINAAQVKRMQDLAENKTLFLMEALWSRFNPVIIEVYKKIKNGALGPISFLRADFAFPALEGNPSGRLLNPELAGGSLLDIGIYPVFLAYLLLGIPKQVKVAAHFHKTGVEKQIGMLFDYPQAMALLYSGFSSRTEMRAEISGKDGNIYLSSPWHEADTYELVDAEGRSEIFKRPLKGAGYTYEIEEVRRCLEAGRIQSDLWSWSDSLALHNLLDQIRNLSGITFPGEF